MSSSRGGFNKSLYFPDVDRRMNLFNAQGLDEVKYQGRSVCCLMRKGYLKEIATGYQLQSGKTLGEYWNLTKNAKFYSEYIFGFGSGFLVAPDLVLTAAHCVCKSSGQLDYIDNQNTRFVFDFQMIHEGQCQETFDGDTVYSIKKVVSFCFSSLNGRLLDWALVKLDRPVKGRVPLVLDFETALSKDDAVDMLGHPSGLPMKYTYDAHIQNADHRDYVEADLDAFGGNSGSCVFHNRKVAAILLRGNTDYETVTTADGKVTTQPHLVTEAERQVFGYEICLRLSVIDITYQLYIKASNGDPEDQHQLGLHYLQNNNEKKGVSWLQKAAHLGHQEALKKLTQLSACQIGKINPHAPAHQQLEKGLNFEASCAAQGCAQNGDTIYIKKGIGNTDVMRTFYDLQCPSCTSPINVRKITSLLFWNCQFNLNGRTLLNHEIQRNDKAKHQHYKKLNVDIEKLIYLDTTTT